MCTRSGTGARVRMMNKGVHFSGLVICYWRLPAKEETALACDGAIIEGSVECYRSINREDFTPWWEVADTQEKTVTKLGPEGQVSDSHTKWEGGEAFQTGPEQRRSMASSENCNCSLLLRLKH